MEKPVFYINNSHMIVRVGFLVAASIAAYAVKQINVKSSNREDNLKKPSGTLIYQFSL